MGIADTERKVPFGVRVCVWEGGGAGSQGDQTFPPFQIWNRPKRELCMLPLRLTICLPISILIVFKSK